MAIRLISKVKKCHYFNKSNKLGINFYSFSYLTFFDVSVPKITPAMGKAYDCLPTLG